MVAAVALHPNVAAEYSSIEEPDVAIDEIAELARQPRVRAVGETGLDYFRTPPELQELQRHSFKRHIEIAKQNNLALVIHDRDAHKDVLKVLEEVNAKHFKLF